MGDRRLTITTFPAPGIKTGGPGPDHADGVIWTRVGELVDLDLQGLGSFLTSPVSAPGKFACPYYVGGALEGGRRALAAVERMSLLSLDIEGGPTTQEAHEAFSPWHHVVYTSWRHEPEAHRFRLVLPLAQDVSCEAYRALWSWAAARMGRGVDPQAKDPSRALFLPAIKPDGSRATAWVWADAPLLDPTPILEAHHQRDAARKATRPPPRRVHVPEDQARRMARHRLRTDRGTRERAAAWLDAHVRGSRAEGVTCPSCGRPSAWFYVEPGAKSTASCNHLNSCGWWGHLDDLLEQQGGHHDQ
jgi:hypothetical protein